MSDVVVALWSGHVSETDFINEGELWEASHPIVKAHPDWFTDDLLAHAIRSPEQPPEPVKRGPGRPKKVVED